MSKQTREELIDEMIEAARTGDLATLRRCGHELGGVDVRDERDASPLIVAAAHGRTEAVEWLLEQKPDPDLKDRFEDSALIEAAAAGHVRIVHMLLEYGADPWITDSNGHTARERADEKGYSTISEMLLVAERVDTTPEWALLGEDCIERNRTSFPLRRKITETFNFSSGMYSITTSDMVYNESTSQPMPIDELPKHYVREVTDQFKRLGGKIKKLRK